MSSRSNSSLVCSLQFSHGIHPLIDEFNPTLQNIDNVDPESILSVVDALRGRPLVFPYLLNSSMPSRTILHLAAALDFHQLLQRILFRYVELIVTLSIFFTVGGMTFHRSIVNLI